MSGISWKGTMSKKEKKSKTDNETGTADKPAAAEDKGHRPRIRFSLRIKFSLAIIALVAMIVFSVTFYFVMRESRLLKEQFFSIAEREIQHLANTAQVTIGAEDIALVEAINGLKKIPYLHYAFILNRDGEIIQYFDRRGEREVERPLADGLDRRISKGGGDSTIEIIEFHDPKTPRITLYDHSRLVLNKLDNKPIGAVIIGLSDRVIRDAIQDAVRKITYISLIILAVSVLCAILLSTIIIRPIRILSQGAAIIGRGNLDHRIDIKSSDELGQLAGEFNEMTSMIKEAKEKEVESRVMEEQLEVAKDIQEGLNPMGYYNTNGIQIKGFTRAAKGVGGDYFDYIEIDEHRIGALISDVSGKGVPASLVMVMIRTIFTTYVSIPGIDCASVVRAINDSLSADFAIDKFATLFFMIYDRSTGEVTFSNAGHGPLYCYRAAKNACTASKLDGVPIGIMEDVDYKQAKAKLDPGDIVFLFTDGISEMRNVAKEEYGLNKVLSFFINNHEKDVNDLVQMLVEDVDMFRGEASPHDDMTVLVFKRAE